MSNVTYKGGRTVKAPRPPKPRKMGWRYFLIWLGGVVSAFAITAIVLGIMGVSFTTKEVITFFGGDPNAFLQESYQNTTMLEMIMRLSTSKFETLGDIYTVTPLAKTIIDDVINPVLKKELNYEYPWEEISTKPFQLPASEREGVDTTEDLGTYVGRAIKENVTLAGFLGEGEIPNFVNLFLYPKDEYGNFDKDHPYTLMDFITGGPDFYNGIIDGVKVKDFVEIDPEDEFMSEIGEWGINDFNSDSIDALSLSYFLPSDSGNTLIEKLRTYTIGDLKEPGTITGIPLGDIITKDENTPKILVTLIDMPCTIGELQTLDLYHTLQVQDVFDTDDNTLLDALKEKYLYELESSSLFDELTLGQVFGIDPNDDSTFVARIQDTTISELQSDSFFAGITLNQLYDEDDIAESKILQALTDEERFPEPLTISDLNDPTVLQQLTIGDVLSQEQISANSILDALSDEPLSSIGSAIDTLTLGSILGIEQGAEGNSHLMDYLAGVQVGNLEESLLSLTLGDVMDLSEYPNLDIPEVRDTSINNFTDLIDVLKANLLLKDVVDIVEDGPNKSPQILITLKDTPLVDLSTVIPSLTLGDMVEIDTSNPLLNALSTVHVLEDGAFATAMNSLELCDVYTESQCTGLMKTIWDSSGGGHILISDLPNALSNLRLTELMQDRIYEKDQYDQYITREIGGVTYKKIDKIWWFLLTEEGESFTSEEEFYVLKNGLGYTASGYYIGDVLHTDKTGFEKAVENFRYHMQSESIQNLYDAGMLEIDSDKVYLLNRVIIYKGQSRKLGSLTMAEFFDFCISYLPGA